MELEEIVVAADARAALDVVDAAERDAPHGELIDERERQRIERLAVLNERRGGLFDGWRAWLAQRSQEPAAYGSLVLSDRHDRATAELVVHPDHRHVGLADGVLQRLESAAREGETKHLSVWARGDEASDRFAKQHGYSLDRRLDVLGRDDHPVPPVDLPEGVVIRRHKPGEDDEGIVRTLNRAFPGSGRPWTPDRLQAHRELAWFDPAGVFVAESGDGRVVGLHWTKDRGGGTGEVHILGLDPEAHGQGLGRALLRTGLQHLYRDGAGEVILWMDHANEPARRLYTSEGFEFRWADRSYGRDL